MESPVPSDNHEIALEIKNLVRYYGDLLAVDNLSLQVLKGEVFGFLGPNGAGKTTSIRMMCGLLKPSAGDVFINGSKFRERDMRTKVGICPQHIVLWNKLSCYEQLVFVARMYDIPGSIARRRADMLIDRIGLKDKRNKMAGTLSGGMKRRMNVIMAIVHDPEIVVFDEPEAGLDPQSRVMVREFIQETARKKTVIFTTHNMDEAERVSDRVAIIDHGKLLKLDTPGNLIRSIGEGDILEFSVQGENQEGLSQAEGMLIEEGFSIIARDPLLVIKGMDIVSKIPKVYSILESQGLLISQMHMRENTLEDVFIHLTGRGLRQ
ncbi:ABC transporter ATP-binding protein [Bacteroidota bacterium]